jgi:flagellar motor switch protein FliN/FliY
MAEQPPSGESPAQQPSAQPAATDAAAQAPPAAADAPVTKESVDSLPKQANAGGEQPAAPASSDNAAAAAAELPGGDAEALKLPSFQQVMADAQVSSIDLLRDVELNVKIELGRARMLVDDVLKLGEGSVVELDKLAGDPVDVFVNERLVARGEVLVLNDNFCVRVNEIVPAAREEAV